MTTIRVDAYPESLDSVQIRDYDDPTSVLETITAVGITEIVGGAYEVTATSTSGNWMLVLFDSSGDSMGVKYASPNYLLAADYPPWLSAEQSGDGSETVIITVRDTDANPIAGASVYISSDELGGTIIQENLSSNSEGKVFTRLNPGTYYLWFSKTDVTFSNPTSITVVDV